MKRIPDVALAGLGGGLVGLGVGLFPRMGFFSEVRNFQVFLLETTYKFLFSILPVDIMRWLGTEAGELVVLSSIGALIGLGVGALFYLAAGRLTRSWAVSPFSIGVSWTAGIFVTLFCVLWCRVVFIHSSDKRMISPEGFLMISGSVLGGAAVSLALWILLRRLARYRLEQASVLLALLALFIGYNGFPFQKNVPSAEATRNSSLPVKQVVLLGGDAANWGVVLPMMREGKLPNLKSLMERGSWGEIRATLPWKSPILWTSIATGKRMKKHGIRDFVVRDPVTREVRPVSLASRKVKAIWNIVSEAGLRVSVAGWYASWPVESLNGTMLSDRFLSPELPDRIFPKERLAEMEKIAAEVQGPKKILDELVTARAGLYLLERDQPNLHMIYLREIDDTQHFFWRFHAARRGSQFARWLYGPTSPAEIAEHGSRIEDAYLRLDEVLGKILEIVGPETVVIVVSDHGAGIKSQRELRFAMNPILEKWGLFRSLPGGKKPDWTQTKIYDSTKQAWCEDRELFINERPEGPFAQGLTPEERRRLLEPIAEWMVKMKTTPGKSFFTKVRIQEEEDEPLHIVARVNVRLKDGENVLIEGGEIPLSEIYWRTDLTGTHRLQGLLVMAGPGIKSGYRLRAASVLDMTPTLLYMLGLPVADDMDGRVLLEAFEPAVREKYPVQRTPTYETGSSRPVSLPQGQGQADEELLDQLRSLGYIQ